MPEELDISKLLYDVKQGFVVLLPSGSSATVREMTGHDQRKFMNKTALANGTAINDLLANCTDTIDDQPLPSDPKERVTAILDLLEGDRSALLFGIRRHSLGDEFIFTMECPHCKRKETWEVDLASQDFSFKAYPHGKDKAIEYDSKVLPGLTVKVRLLDGHGSMAVMKKGDAMDLLTDLEVRLPQYKNKDQWVGMKLQLVSDRVLGELRQKLREAEGQVDSRVTVTCKNCSNPATFDLLQVPDFMIPNVTS